MNRFKFRVWSKETNEFLDSEYFRITGFGAVENYTNENENDTNCVIQQFTGLLDKNRKEIFEGDIIKKYWNPNKQDQGFNCFEVKWNEQHSGFGVAVGNNHYYEIIGNIFENPELLK